MKVRIAVALGLALINPAQGSERDQAGSPAGSDRDAHLISAFFGLDNGLPMGANVLCLGAGGQDGMPVVLSRTIDPETLDPEDFSVTTSAGVENIPHCVTLRPATDAGEGRTVLLIGEFGNAPDGPPARVRIVGDLMSGKAAGEQINFRGAEVHVIPLEDGPSLVWAEIVDKDVWSVRGRGTACPSGSQQVVRVTWAGGVRLPGRAEPGDPERALYRVNVTHPDGSTEAITPAALADLNDNDNNHLLCLDTLRPATAVTFPAGHLVDPNGDLNPATQVSVWQGNERP